INKDILELNLDVKVLAPKRTPNVELEADKLFTATQGVTLVSGQQCSDVLGEGWESTPNGAFGNTVNKYCPFLSVGQTCCGRIPSTASSDVPLGVISYTIGYKSSDFKNLGAACFASETVTATTQPECVGLMLDAKQAHPDGEILKECNESVVRQPSPALAALPMCSK
ncbi:hypothetical protein KKH15_00005, partial [Patescibacteria group bacterium]|nr:hypothetical protein [Patescibacteria group bacterium]